ncbi:MAG: hypothetical protein M0005_06450 [Actinomycetota bacterium]|nr:hypothetical protein [Actinomycetota bacterium]
MSAGGVIRGIDGPDGERDATQTPAPVAPTGVVSTRAGRAWVEVLPALLILALILVFIFQNSQSAKVSFVTVSGRLPLAIALLAAATLGALVVLARSGYSSYAGMIHRSWRQTQAHHPESGAR